MQILLFEITFMLRTADSNISFGCFSVFCTEIIKFYYHLETTITICKAQFQLVKFMGYFIIPKLNFPNLYLYSIGLHSLLQNILS